MNLLTKTESMFVMIFLLEIVCFISALGLEIASMLMIVENHSAGSDLLTPFFSHLTASIASVIVLPKFLTSPNQTHNPINLLFFFIIAFYIPVLGMLGLAFAVVPGLRPIKAGSKLSINFNRIREFSSVPADRSLHFEYGAVSLENLLRSQNPDKRMTAVYATLKLDDKNAIPLLRTALRDPVDDIRLLAYALIDRKEQRISERIEQARQSLENNETTTNTRHLYKCIVKDYWELAHLGLVEGETLNYVLNKTREYLEKALKLYPKDRGLHLQYAKLLLRLKNPKKAYDEFKMAEALGVGKKQLLLYYAEIDFLQRRYGEVKRYMKEIDLVTAHPQIHAAKRFWQENS
jgi:polysaccharide biosynthesis protein PelE